MYVFDGEKVKEFHNVGPLTDERPKRVEFVKRDFKDEENGKGEVRQVSRSRVFKGFVAKGKNRVLNALRDRKPVKIF